MSWMKSLSEHYHNMSETYPQSQIMIVFDIDDTIVDIRIPLLYVLQKYDSNHDTSHFMDLTLEDIVFEEWHIQDWLPRIVNDPSEREKIVKFVRSEMWQEDTIFLSHRPFRGVLEIIRWFQIQDNTTVGLNTGRSSSLRDVTLNSLNVLGKEYRVHFSPDLLYMNPLQNKLEKDITSYKAKGIQYFQENGYKVIAFVDNEPANLKVIEDVIGDPNILLLHADTMFGSSRELIPERSVIGREYQFSDIVEPKLLPKHISFVWNGVNNDLILDAYINSNVFWAELDVRRHPLTRDLVLRHAAFDTPAFQDQNLFRLKDMLNRLKPIDKGIKIVLKEDEGLLDEVIEILLAVQIASDKLWFDIIFEVFYEEGLKHIRDCFPHTIISTRVDFLVPLMSQFPMYVADILDKLSHQGINQYSISFNTYNKEIFTEKMDEWGFDVNIRDIYTFEEFLQAILFLPTSIVSTFDFDTRQIS
ncbi:MAG: hypothetical protein GPJ54_16460 [Candidatus Heimdallarchaeota archaeon]|nr:hypothetical protein [Candidatus Heimdallarchaeota archaeon]